MVTTQLIDYINQSLSAGQSRDQITQILMAQGWVYLDIQEAFSVTQSQNNNQTYNNNQSGSQNNNQVNSQNRGIGYIIWKIIKLALIFLLGLFISGIIMFGLRVYTGIKNGNIFQEIFEMIPIVNNAKNNLDDSDMVDQADVNKIIDILKTLED